MNAHEFRTLVERARSAHPLWFELEADPPASAEEIARVGASLGVKLPQDYSQFLREYGGGYFAMASVFSVRDGSPFNVVERNAEQGFPAKGFLAISDNGVGDYYGYRVTDGEARPGIFLADHDRGYELIPTEFSDVFDFLAHNGLQAR